MAHEVAMVFDKDGKALYWLDGTGASVADSRSLWDVLWEHRESLGGVAHTHPWDGPTGPSGTDLTTFAAIESGLGKKLFWPIITMTHELYCGTCEHPKGYYENKEPPFINEIWWEENILKLRELSQRQR